MKPSLLIVGLGNPGKQYERTRHNVGFQAIDVLSEKFGEGEWKESGKFEALIQEGRIVAFPVLLVKPLTFMNLSGTSVRHLVDFYKLDAKTQIIVIADDIDLPLGTIRLRQKGSAGTHNGYKSLVETFGEDFPRIRIGIGPKPTGADLANWVLSALTAEETKTLNDVYASLPEKIKEFVMEKKVLV